MLALLAQDSSSSGGAVVGTVLFIVYLAFLALIVVSLWKVYVKMTQPGWYGIIPIFNYVVIAKLSGKEWWFGLICIVPCIGWIFVIILLNDLAQLFGKGVGYTIGLIFLPFIFLPMLAFGSAQYQGPQGQAF
jgi:Family of unknown function (DUF5684)